jgi:hypothetical protein
MQSSTEDHLAGLRDRGGGGAKVAFDREEAKMMHGGIDLQGHLPWQLIWTAPSRQDGIVPLFCPTRQTDFVKFEFVQTLNRVGWRRVWLRK